jgi:hypothetical protein
MINCRRAEIPEIIAVDKDIFDGREFHTVNTEIVEFIALDGNTCGRHRAHADSEMREFAVRHRDTRAG